MSALPSVIYLLVAYLALLLLPFASIHLVRKRIEAKHRSPLSQMLLRGPGETLRNELDNSRTLLLTYMILLSSLPLLIFSTHISISYFGGEKESVFRIATSVAFGVGIIIKYSFAIRKLVGKIKILRLGYEGELAIAQELNLLMRSGAYVFHDFPAEGFNIDHVIISSKGVYAVETKCRMKNNMNRGAVDATVVFDKHMLQFPGRSETEPLEQAVRQARWLEKWLSGAVGESVKVKPVLALPGWKIDRKGRSDIVIISGRNAAAVFEKLYHDNLSDEMIKRIAHQVEQRCRDVKPRYFRKMKIFQ